MKHVQRKISDRLSAAGGAGPNRCIGIFPPFLGTGTQRGCSDCAFPCIVLYIVHVHLPWAKSHCSTIPSLSGRTLGRRPKDRLDKVIFSCGSFALDPLLVHLPGLWPTQPRSCFFWVGPPQGQGSSEVSQISELKRAEGGFMVGWKGVRGGVKKP